MNERAVEPWLRMPLALCRIIVEEAEQGPKPWPKSAAAAFLVLAQDESAGPRRTPFPKRPDLMEKWGWTERKVRTLLATESLWKDPTKPIQRTERPADVRQTSGERPADVRHETDEPEESAEVRPASDREASGERPASVHTRVVVPQAHAQAHPTGKTKRAGKVRQVDLVWALYCERQAARGVDHRDRPPKGWGVGDRVREFGEDAVRLVIEWAHDCAETIDGIETRAGFLRRSDCLGQTLFRTSNFPGYLAMAKSWHAAGRPTSDPNPRATPKPQARGRDRPPAEHERTFADERQNRITARWTDLVEAHPDRDPMELLEQAKAEVNAA